MGGCDLLATVYCVVKFVQPQIRALAACMKFATQNDHITAMDRRWKA